MIQISVTNDQYWDYHKAFNYPPDDIAKCLKSGIDIEKMYENLKRTGQTGEYHTHK